MVTSTFALLLILFPLLTSSAFLGLGADILKDKELETYISINSKSWGNDRAALYTYEISSPQQEIVKKGIAFNTNFARTHPTKSLFIDGVLKTSNGDKQVNVFPYRNMQKITCDDHLRNKFQFYANSNFYQFWVDLWASDCKTLANYLDTNRVARQAKLSEVVGKLASYANTYVESNRETTNFNLRTASNTDSISTQEFNIRLTETSIQAFQAETSKRAYEIAEAEKKNVDYTTKAENLRAEIDQNYKNIQGLEESIEKLESDANSHADSKAQYDKNAEDALKKVEELLALLKIEAPGANGLEGLAEELKKSRNIQDFENVLRDILPS